MKKYNRILLSILFWVGLSMSYGQDSVFVYNRNKAKIYYSIDYSTLYVELDRTAGEEEKEEAIAEMSSYSEMEIIVDNIYRLNIEDSDLREEFLNKALVSEDSVTYSNGRKVIWFPPLHSGFFSIDDPGEVCENVNNIL